MINNIYETTDISGLDALLEANTSNNAEPPDTTQAILHNLLASAQETNNNLFITQEIGRWAVIAASTDHIARVDERMRPIMDLQANITARTLSGQCRYAHEYASALGISDGNLVKVDRNMYADSPFPGYGHHEIGYADSAVAGLSVYFDLTAKLNAFSEWPHTSAILEGVIVVDDYQRTEVISRLYRSDDWLRRPFRPNQPLVPDLVACSRQYDDYRLENSNHTYGDFTLYRGDMRYLLAEYY